MNASSKMQRDQELMFSITVEIENRATNYSTNAVCNMKGAHAKSKTYAHTRTHTCALFESDVMGKHLLSMYRVSISFNNNFIHTRCC